MIEFFLTLLVINFQLSGVVALISLLGTTVVGLIGLFIKQIKDMQEIQFSVKQDREVTQREFAIIDKEIDLLKIQLQSQGDKDEEMLNILHEIKIDIAVLKEQKKDSNEQPKKSSNP